MSHFNMTSKTQSSPASVKDSGRKSPWGPPGMKKISGSMDIDDRRRSPYDDKHKKSPHDHDDYNQNSSYNDFNKRSPDNDYRNKTTSNRRSPFELDHRKSPSDRRESAMDVLFGKKNMEDDDLMKTVRKPLGEGWKPPGMRARASPRTQKK